MILIADSGSTKTDWSCINDREIIRFKTIGLNPYFVSVEQVEQEVSKNIPQEIDKDAITEVHFFGSGCGRIESQNTIKNGLQLILKNAKIIVESDLFGAGFACYGPRETGIIAILGTGMNIGFWQGPASLQTPLPSLGFILGDAGSGASLGKRLLKAIFEEQLSSHIIDKFQDTYNLSVSELLDKIYKQPRANAFLASFVPFLSENRDEVQLQNIVNDAFDEFTSVYASRFSMCKTISFVGSIAKVFETNLRYCLSKKGFKISQIVNAPITLLEERFMQ